MSNSRLGSRLAIAAAAAAIVCAAAAAPALGDFPYTRPAGNPKDHTDLYLDSANPVPNDVEGDGNGFKFAASPDPSNPVVNADPVELGGVRGMHVADANGSLDTAWKLTTGRPEVTIAVLDSGIRWDEAGTMHDLAEKVRLNRDELPLPNHTRPAPLAVHGKTIDCTTYAAAYDANDDGVFNLTDYACDSRINVSDARRAGPSGVFTPEDVIIAFSDGTDADGNGFVDDIAGWDFLDNDNDAYDDVQYGHGTGEAKDSNAEANNGEGQAGSCPSCTFIPLRVGDSFVADSNRFAQAVLYATDNGVLVVQEALGALNNSTLSREAVDYAYRHGVTVIASAADEAAQHNNWPSTLPHVIVVNSVRDNDISGGTPFPHSYLAFNGCTNFSAKITLAIESTSCSSNATGLGAGQAGLVYAAALNAKAKGALANYPSTALCRRPNGDPCLITPNEVRQLMASGSIGPPGSATGLADDVNFAGSPPGSGNEPSCSPAPVPNCTDPNLALNAQVQANRPSLEPGGPTASRSYPARKGHDQFYGYGRSNMAKTIGALLSNPVNPAPSKLPPEVEITSPEWFQPIDPSKAKIEVDGQVFARGQSYSCRLLVAPGHYPNNNTTTQSPPGDFLQVSGGPCDGTARTAALDGKLGEIDVATLKSQFPAATAALGFQGREPGAGVQTSNGRPNTDPYGFTIKVVASTTQGGTELDGEDDRAAFLHRDQDMISGFPKTIRGHDVTSSTPTGDGESSPAFADLDGDNRNEMIFGSSDGFVHALRPDGTELPGWPVRGDRPALHLGGQAFSSGAVSSNLGGAMVASIAVGDANRDGVPEVYAADLEGQVYGWAPNGVRTFHQQSDIAFSGKPLQPFVNVRRGGVNRTQHGFIASPVLGDLDGDGKQEIVIAGMDRHIYAWKANGDAVSGFPSIVVDPAKVQSIDPQTHAVTFKPNVGAGLNQGSIVDTPALADLTGDGKPEIVVGTNEEYDVAADGGFNDAGPGTFNLLDLAGQALAAFKQQCRDNGGPDAFCDNIPGSPFSSANGRLYAIKGTGDADGNPATGDELLAGWPVKLGILDKELLPVVGEGVDGPPVVASLTCPTGGAGPKVGDAANNGPAYIFNADGTSCYGQAGGKDRSLQAEVAAGAGKYDTPAVPAVGNPAFGDLGGPSPSFVMPAAGVLRALDVIVSEYQGGQDFVAAWDTTTGQFRPGYPSPVNDLQFLTGPSVADIDGNPGDEVLEGTASKDLAAIDPAGAPVNVRWPKVTTDWSVAGPLVGSFGTRDTDASAHKVVIGMTRSGYVNAYTTDAQACSPSSSPRFHHDNVNSGDFSRDAVLPGAIEGLALSNDKSSIGFKAPGDDLLCGRADHYEIVTSANPIGPGNFKDAQPLAGPPAPQVAGQSETYSLPAGTLRYVAVRAVDDQGNVGRMASVDRGGGTPPTDTDGDGVTDDQDQCPAQAGPASNNGCPNVQPGDSDGDGVPNDQDSCPTAPGPPSSSGCPLGATKQMTLRVNQRNARTNKTYSFHFTVRSINTGCVGGVTIRLGSDKARTDSSGRATIRRSFSTPGTKTARASKTGCTSATTTIRARD
ncbi:MAG: hypothetical protein QOG09_1374 [Solirubrobacterales bacterium]|nr:hypothetical protein [Solirubrobacterales bacterium]